MRKADSVLRYVGFVMMIISFCISEETVTGQEKELLAPNRVEDGAPPWLKTYKFKKKFTFVRLRYEGPRPYWATDYPDADINLSRRLQFLTTLDVSPNGVLDPIDPKLADYPFAYISGSGKWVLSDKQAAGLRRYLEQGGFLMIDDSWGDDEWKNIIAQLSKVLPNQAPKELPLQHKIFHCVFDFIEKPQVCSIHAALKGREEGITWERPDGKDVSYQGITDERGRLIVLICHNNDLADGWEREGDDVWYFREFSQKRAFPMGINIVFYALTSSD